MRYLEAAIMALWGLIFFLLVEVCIFLPLYLVGLPVAYCASRWAATKTVPSRLYPDRQILAYANPVLDWWVGNYEDGCAPVFDWWHGSGFAWFLRNPVCNLRFAPLISTKPDPVNVHWIGSNAVPADGVPGCFLAWQGGFVGFLYQNTRWGVWLGWKINPREAFYIAKDDYRQWGIGTACQFMRF